MTDAISIKDLPENVQKKLKTLADISGKSLDTLIKEYNLILNSKDLKNLEISIKYEKAFVELYKRYCNTNTVPLMNDGKEIAVLHIIGRNKFQIKDNNDKIVYPPTSVSGKDVVWYSSDHYRQRISKKLESKLKLNKEKATDIIDTLCGNVDEKIKQLEKNGFFKKHIEKDLQAVLDNIKSSKLICCQDGNIYNIFITHINNPGNIEISKTIHLMDKQFYDEPKAFCIHYLTHFNKRIEITLKQWTELFIPKIQSVLEPETEKIESTCDMITTKFIQYLKSQNMYDWEDADTRKNYKKCIFFDTQHNWVMVFKEFIDDFFIKEKIIRDYKKTQGNWNSYLQRKEDKYLVKKSTTGRPITKQKPKRFWCFYPEKIEVSKDKIKEKTKTDDGKSATATEKYGNVEVTPVED